MIVSPDFPDHWKTREVVRLCGSADVVLCIIRFWSHCQNRRKWIFDDLNPTRFAAICGWTGDVGAFWNAMVGTFLDKIDGGHEAHDWAEVNASLIAAWERGKYGAQGGRPPSKTPEETSKVTLEVTSMAPLEEPDKIRLEKSREEKKTEGSLRSPSPRTDGVATWSADKGFVIPTEVKGRWKVAYPACDIDRQAAAAHEWLIANPAKQKKSPHRFLNNWLLRHQERGGDAPSNRPAAQQQANQAKDSAWGLQKRIDTAKARIETIKAKADNFHHPPDRDSRVLRPGPLAEVKQLRANIEQWEKQMAGIA